MREIYEQLQNLDFAHCFVFDVSLVRTLDKMPQLGCTAGTNLKLEFNQRWSA